jgi:hypothetical protein
VCGAIKDKYNSLGGPSSFLLWPSSAELTNPDGVGKRTQFLNGPIYWSAAGGAHPVVNSFLNRWGVHGYEAGWLGYPTTDEIVHADAIGRRQEFQNGAIYVSIPNAIGSAIRNGPIRDKWNDNNAETPGSLLGYPTGDEIGLPDGVGRMARFERGVIYSHPVYGAQPVTGAILAYWGLMGYEQSDWGYPLDDQYTDSNGVPVQDFQNDTVEVQVAAGGVTGPDPRYTWYYTGDTWQSIGPVARRDGGRPTETIGGIDRFNWGFKLSDQMLAKGRQGPYTKMACSTESYRNSYKQTWYNDDSHLSIFTDYHLHGSIPNTVTGDKYLLTGKCAFPNIEGRQRPDGTIRFGTTLVDFEMTYIFLDRAPSPT